MITMKTSITSPVSEGQKTEFADVVSNAVRKAMRAVVDEFSGTGLLNKENFQRVLAQGDRIVTDVTTRVKETLAELAENIIDRLKLISGAKNLVLKPTTGERTVTSAKNVFRAYIDPDFKNWELDVEGKSTPETKVQVYELVKDGTFAQIFGGLGKNLDDLCLTQEQIIQFAETHCDWFSTNFWTFFLFKVGEKFFVAGVDLRGSGYLRVRVCRLSDDNVWHAKARRRFVLPQL